MASLNILEELRTKEELINYFKQLGKEISEEDLNALKQSYDQAQESSGALTLDQLSDVAGGTVCKVTFDFLKIVRAGQLTTADDLVHNLTSYQNSKLINRNDDSKKGLLSLPEAIAPIFIDFANTINIGGSSYDINLTNFGLTLTFNNSKDLSFQHFNVKSIEKKDEGKFRVRFDNKFLSCLSKTYDVASRNDFMDAISSVDRSMRTICHITQGFVAVTALSAAAMLGALISELSK